MNEMGQAESGDSGGYVLGQPQHIRAVPAGISSRDLVWEDELLRMRLANRLAVQRDRLFGIIRMAVDEGGPDMVPLLKQAVSSIEQALTSIQSTGRGISVLSNLQPTAADLAIFYDLNYLLLAPATQLKERLDRLSEAITSHQSIEKGRQDLTFSMEALDGWQQRQTSLLDRLKQQLTEKSQALTVRDAALAGESQPLPRPLSLRQRVTYDYVDYMVIGRSTYFADQKNWFLYELGGGDGQRWLLFEGASMPSVLEECPLAASDLGKETIAVDGEQFTLSGCQTVDLVNVGETGRTAALGITYQRFCSPSGRVLYVEKQGDKIVTRLGRNIQPEDLDINVAGPV